MSDVSRLPPAERRELELGYLRLSDSAPLILAQELGYYEKYGLTVHLRREVSWANVRDKLVTGNLDAAQMLAPLPLATSMGVGGMRADIITGLALSLNGNAITLGHALSSELASRGSEPSVDACSSARALAAYLADNNVQLTLAAAHSFSCHILQLRHWLMAGGIDPERDVRIIVLPPEQMVDSLARGIIDGFCVGEPWNSIAVQHGIGAIQATGHQVWNNSLEKVLAVTENWHSNHPGTHLRLRLALMEACQWLSDGHNRGQAVKVLAEERFLGLSEANLTPSLEGQLVFAKGGAVYDQPHFHIFGRYQAGFPWRSEGERLLQHIGTLLGKPLGEDDIKSQVQRCFRTDLYRDAARHLAIPCPNQDYKPVNSHSEAWELEPGIELGADQLLPY